MGQYITSPISSPVISTSIVTDEQLKERKKTLEQLDDKIKKLQDGYFNRGFRHYTKW